MKDIVGEEEESHRGNVISWGIFEVLKTDKKRRKKTWWRALWCCFKSVEERERADLLPRALIRMSLELIDW